MKEERMPEIILRETIERKIKLGRIRKRYTKEVEEDLRRI